jgi:hypothetical protein
MSNEHIYLNCTAFNETNVTRDAQININRNDIIVNNSSEYSLAVVRAEFSVESIPIFTFIDDNFQMCLSTTTNPDNGFQSALAYVSYDSLNPADRGIYSYQQFLDSFNNCMNNLYGPTVGISGVGNPPVMEYDNAGRFQLNMTGSTSILNGSVKILVNENLKQMFPTFNWKRSAFYIFGPQQQYCWELIIPAATNIYKQYSSGTAAWLDVRNLLLVSDDLPVNGEAYSSNKQLNSNSSGADMKNILIDLGWPMKSGADESTPASIQFVQYVPTSVYRLLDLKAGQYLKNVNISILWVDRFGVARPLKLLPGDTVSLKLAFIKKTPLIQSS